MRNKLHHVSLINAGEWIIEIVASDAEFCQLGRLTDGPTRQRTGEGGALEIELAQFGEAVPPAHHRGDGVARQVKVVEQRQGAEAGAALGKVTGQVVVRQVDP